MVGVTADRYQPGESLVGRAPVAGHDDALGLIDLGARGKGFLQLPPELAQTVAFAHVLDDRSGSFAEQTGDADVMGVKRVRARRVQIEHSDGLGSPLQGNGQHAAEPGR